jgi:hypothetical protein
MDAPDSDAAEYERQAMSPPAPRENDMLFRDDLPDWFCNAA